MAESLAAISLGSGLEEQVGVGVALGLGDVGSGKRVLIP